VLAKELVKKTAKGQGGKKINSPCGRAVNRPAKEIEKKIVRGEEKKVRKSQGPE